jgi:hypothetical protein
MNYNYIILKFPLLGKKNQLKKKFLSLLLTQKLSPEHNQDKKRNLNITTRKISKISKKLEVIFL